jgi:mono/diheme cytochrome c family protein
MALALVGVALLAVSCGKSQESATMSATPPMTPAERGKYLTTIMGCNDCHTPGALYGVPDMSRALSGSELGWQGPWGVSFPRNLTPDTETGIGSWTEDDIVKALRTGYRPDGTQLMPPMPWAYFASLSDDDVRAIAVYLKSLPAIRHQNLPHLPPGSNYAGAALRFPPPPDWDVPSPKK